MNLSKSSYFSIAFRKNNAKHHAPGEWIIHTLTGNLTSVDQRRNQQGILSVHEEGNNFELPNTAGPVLEL